MPLLPRLTMNRRFVQDFLAAPPPCFAFGFVEDQGQVMGCIAMRPARPLPVRSTQQGFRLGHCVLGLGEQPVFQFTFEFYDHARYHGLVNPSHPIVQAVIDRMLATNDYFFFAIDPEQTVTAFRSQFEAVDVAGLRTNQARFRDVPCATTAYERVVAAFTTRPEPPGQVMAWVCQEDKDYGDLTTQRLDLNPSL